MGYRSLRECIDDLAVTGQLIRIDDVVDPHLEAAEIQRRVYRQAGPAIYYARVKGCRFPLVSNLFGTLARARYIFRDTLDAVRQLVQLQVEPADFWRHPQRFFGLARTALTMRPRRCRTGPVLANRATIDQLPQLVSWPDDGGAFITLPQVYTEDPDRPGLGHSNLGMYRVQISGGEYRPNRDVGLHYQLHRGIGGHHAAAIRAGVPLRVNIFVGGPPAMNLAAVLPLPEGMSELRLAGPLGGRRVRMIERPGALPIHADADFCIVGTVAAKRRLPEGPFGDHLGYYSLQHDYPVLEVQQVYHRHGAVWPFTVVGRPPQEDTVYGQLIHELTAPAVPSVLPGVRAVHAVDAAGVHPLLLAVGSERYTPYAPADRPQELLTQANAILGQGQLSLAKYLLIAAQDDAPQLDVHDVPGFFQHLLERVDWRRDLHFQTRTTIDTLDYSGTGLHQGSKLVIAAAGPARRTLPAQLPADLRLPDGFRNPRVALPGILIVEGPPYAGDRFGSDAAVARLCNELQPGAAACTFPCIVLVDDSAGAARSVNDFLWTAFTRSNPAADVHGVDAFVEKKHWGCRGPLVLDGRSKPHHAPPLVEDRAVTRRVDALAAAGGPLHGVLS